MLERKFRGEKLSFARNPGTHLTFQIFFRPIRDLEPMLTLAQVFVSNLLKIFQNVQIVLVVLFHIFNEHSDAQ